VPEGHLACRHKAHRKLCGQQGEPFHSDLLMRETRDRVRRAATEKSPAGRADFGLLNQRASFDYRRDRIRSAATFGVLGTAAVGRAGVRSALPVRLPNPLPLGLRSAPGRPAGGPLPALASPAAYARPAG